MYHTSISIHGKPSALTAGTVKGSLIIECNDDDDHYSAITFFTGDPPLVKALVDAFNAATAEPAASEAWPTDADDTQYGERA
jgi:hypothetical protein